VLFSHPTFERTSSYSFQQPKNCPPHSPPNVRTSYLAKLSIVLWGLWPRKKEMEVPRHARHRSPLHCAASYPFAITTKYGSSPGLCRESTFIRSVRRASSSHLELSTPLTKVVMSSWSFSLTFCVLNPRLLWSPPLAGGRTNCSMLFVI